MDAHPFFETGEGLMKTKSQSAFHLLAGMILILSTAAARRQPSAWVYLLFEIDRTSLFAGYRVLQAGR
jgi:hypothetical protein